MCMPRRIVVRVAQALNEKWSKELAHHERMSDEIRVSDSICAEIALDEELGDLARQGLDGCLAEGFRGWRAEGRDFVKEIDGVKATFSPATRKITLSAAMADVLTAMVEKKYTLEGQFKKELSTLVDVGPFSWAAPTDIASIELQFERQLTEELETDRRTRIEAAQASLRQQVKREMADKWTALTQEKRREMTRLVREQLQTSRAEVEAEVNHLLSESYRRALLLLARQQNGRVTREEESGSVIDLEITL